MLNDVGLALFNFSSGLPRGEICQSSGSSPSQRLLHFASCAHIKVPSIFCANLLGTDLDM